MYKNIFVNFFRILVSHFFCQDKLDESACKTLADYQTATVTLLALLSAAPDDVSNFYSCIIHMYMSLILIQQNFDHSLKYQSNASYVLNCFLLSSECATIKKDWDSFLQFRTSIGKCIHIIFLEQFFHCLHWIDR